MYVQSHKVLLVLKDFCLRAVLLHHLFKDSALLMQTIENGLFSEPIQSCHFGDRGIKGTFPCSLYLACNESGRSQTGLTPYSKQ